MAEGFFLKPRQCAMRIMVSLLILETVVELISKLVFKISSFLCLYGFTLIYKYTFT